MLLLAEGGAVSIVLSTLRAGKPSHIQSLVLCTLRINHSRFLVLQIMIGGAKPEGAVLTRRVMELSWASVVRQKMSTAGKWASLHSKFWMDADSGVGPARPWFLRQEGMLGETVPIEIWFRESGRSEPHGAQRAM